MRLTILALGVALCLIEASAYAAQGDLLFQCSFDGSGATPQEVWRNCDPANTNIPPANGAVSIINTGCVSGKCYKMNFTTATGSYKEDWFPMKFYPPGTKHELTIEFYEKYSKTRVDFGNVKQIRGINPTAEGTTPYLLSGISFHSNWSGDRKPWQTRGSFHKARLYKYSDKFDGWSAQCVDGSFVSNVDGSNSWDCTNGRLVHNYLYKESILPVTNWIKVRIYVKLPTTSTSTDGEIWHWVNDELMFKVVNADRPGMSARDMTEIIWEPSIGAKENLEHYYDEIKVWEGFVAPDGSSPPQVPSSPTSLLIE